MAKKERNVDFKNGLVVWAPCGLISCWPALIVDRDSLSRGQDSSTLMKPLAKHSRIVQFFDSDKKVATFNVSEIVEYTSNMLLMDLYAGTARREFVKACEEAFNYIEEHGLQNQKELLLENNVTAGIEQSETYLQRKRVDQKASTDNSADGSIIKGKVHESA